MPMINRGNRKLTLLPIIIFLLLFISSGCNSEEAPLQEAVIGEMSYTVIPIPSADFDTLNRDDFNKWYQQNHKIKGAHSFTSDGDRYLIISAGEKPTGGYTIDTIRVLGQEEQIDISARLHVPDKNEPVAQVLTYPHLLLKIASDNRPVQFREFEEYTSTPETRQDSGTYIGRIDNLSVEIKISGVPEEQAYRAYELNDDLRENLDKIGLQEGDAITFTYIEKSIGRPVITEINKIKN